MSIKKVYFVGAGPGDAGLITVRGREILRQADTVIYDYLLDIRLLEEAKEGAELICCDTLGKKRYSDGFSNGQDKINALIVREAKEGKRVLRLKNGDPAIFSRISQELEALNRNKIDYEIVPGVTAASSASAFSGIPLTDRRFASNVIFVTGHEDINKKESSIDYKGLVSAGTIVFYMAVENFSGISEKLISEGKPKGTAVVAISNAGKINQKVAKGNLGNICGVIKRAGIIAPAILIVGKAATLEKEFNWLRKTKRVLFTGLSKERFFLDGLYFHLPLIKIEPIADYKELDNHLKNIRDFDWVIFTSRYAVEYFFKRLNSIGYDSRVLRDINIAVIGESTNNHLRSYGVNADLIPKLESSKGLLSEFKKINLRNIRVFFPRSDIADKGLTKALKGLGAQVTASVAYKNVIAKDLPDLDLSFFHEIMFTSPSGVRSFVKRYGKVPKKVKVSCIGEVTLNEAKKCHLSG
ncbi:MAG: uroporphyrinogen-III C-methyltransferase [Candidatus Omnitrophota bacterium]